MARLCNVSSRACYRADNGLIEVPFVGGKKKLHCFASCAIHRCRVMYTALSAYYHMCTHSRVSVKCMYACVHNTLRSVCETYVCVCTHTVDLCTLTAVHTKQLAQSVSRQQSIYIKFVYTQYGEWDQFIQCVCCCNLT